MKKIIAIGIIGMFILTSFSVFVVAEEPNSSDQITLDYAFGTPVISDVDIDGTNYDQITIEDAPVCGNPGEPGLPAKGAYILIPQGEKVSSIIVNHGEMINLGSGFLVEPVGQPVPLSEVDSAPLPVPDETIYSSNEMFPGELFTEVGTYNCKGYEILVGRLHPVQYVPATGELFYYPDLSVSVETVEDGDVSPLFRGLEKDELEIMDKVENPAMVGSYALNTQQQTVQGQPLTLDNYDLLIITSEALKDGFIPLKLAHDADGLNTLIYTVEDIYNEYSGVDDAEKVRNFIKYAYNTYKIEYVLLGGDEEIVPVRYFHVRGGTEMVLSDLYYAGLDGNWNIPETPNPPHMDISINDPGVSGYCTGTVTGPVVDNTNYIIGGSSMRCNCTEGGDDGSLVLTFNTPKDISDENWLRLYLNCSRPNLLKEPFTGGYKEIYLYDWMDRECHITSFDYSTSIGSWETRIYSLEDKTIQNLAKDPLFNFHKVVKIAFNFNFRYHTEDDFIRVDGIYFSDYSNLLYGEPGEDDLYAEVYVGRACVDTLSDVQNFTSKTISYMNTDPEDDTYLKNVTMAGEYLGGLGEGQWGGNYMDELIGKCYKHWYITQGFPANKFNIDKLYDRDWEENGWPEPHIGKGGWPKDLLINRINQGVHIINHLGHANNEINMKMSISDVDALTNDKYCFIYSQGCFAGSFDNKDDDGNLLPYDCIAEHFTVKTSHGAFAGIWNSRYGFGGSFGFVAITDGPSQRYHRQFWDAVFRENITVISKANQDSKEDNIWRINEWICEDGMRYIYYGLTLFGDPAVKFKYLDSSLAVSMPASRSSSQLSSQQSTTTTTTTATTSSTISGQTSTNR